MDFKNQMDFQDSLDSSFNLLASFTPRLFKHTMMIRPRLMCPNLARVKHGLSEALPEQDSVRGAFTLDLERTLKMTLNVQLHEDAMFGMLTLPDPDGSDVIYQHLIAVGLSGGSNMAVWEYGMDVIRSTNPEERPYWNVGVPGKAWVLDACLQNTPEDYETPGWLMSAAATVLVPYLAFGFSHWHHERMVERSQ